MKKKIIVLLFTVLAMITITIAQTTKKTWPEMKTFHSFMSSTFHPSEDGDLVPLKAKADSLLIAAQSWKASAIPSDFKPEETRAALDKLVKQCQAIRNAVSQKSPDDKLKKMIKEAHDTFHTIVGECRKAEE
ncbi:MAG: hypothetical protein IPP31_05560 [Chitinophagaceae bacterium]|nr:hypothetical protein [Chitinophagaceae bacterium]